MFRIRTIASGTLLTLAAAACSDSGGGDGTGMGGGGGSGGGSLTDPLHNTSNGGSTANSQCPALAAGTYTVHYNKLSQIFDCPQLEDKQLIVEADGDIVEPDLADSGSCTDRVTEDGCTRTRVVSCREGSCSGGYEHEVDRETWSGELTLTSRCSGQDLTCRYDTWVTPR